MFNGIAFISYKLYKFRYSDYSEVCEKIKKVVQKNSVILAPTTYWFGLENDCKFRSFDLPYHFIKEYNESYEHAVKVIDPDYIVIDNYWNKIYANDKDKRENYLKNYCDKIHSITDNYYGRASERGIENKNIIIYKVKK
jgi:hypothetical protein